jgi:hypothetical protein
VTSDYNYNLEIFGKPILEMRVGKNIEIFNSVYVKDFLPVARRINIILNGHYRKSDNEDSSRVKSKSKSISVKDL